METLAFALAIASDDDLMKLASIMTDKYGDRAERFEFLLGVAHREKNEIEERVCEC